MTIFKANFSPRYSILFSGSRDFHDNYKWVATQRSLGTAELTYTPDCLFYSSCVSLLHLTDLFK